MSRLIIPEDARCLTPSCKGTPTHVFSIRMRRIDTSAAWAPNVPAFFCDDCATRGGELEIKYTPVRKKFYKKVTRSIVWIRVMVENGMAPPRFATRVYDIDQKKTIAVSDFQDSLPADYYA
jgi:hypothetical protein